MALQLSPLPSSPPTNRPFAMFLDPFSALNLFFLLLFSFCLEPCLLFASMGKFGWRSSTLPQTLSLDLLLIRTGLHNRSRPLELMLMPPPLEMPMARVVLAIPPPLLFGKRFVLALAFHRSPFRLGGSLLKLTILLRSLP
ncbi:hypothetical protein AMTRI_Chr13g117280 [Amborella trichopoda]